ncbi:MAG: hypothetical protein H5T34_00815 [Candidatus Methanomethyliales bacterium]|nr:hypothetical protein [Candidatus Methanomethylicales archaeon]
MKIAWLHGNMNVSLDKPLVWLCLGVRGSGKSTFLEHVALQHLQHGNTILDLFGARSGEGLAWLRSPEVKGKHILLLTDEGCIIEVNSSLDLSIKPYTKLQLKDFEDFDLIINSSPLYRTLDSEFTACNHVIDLLWNRLHWRRLIYVIIREAANLIYSRVKVSENQLEAKSFLIYWLRESRHVGCSLGLDSQRFMALDTDVRSQVDFLVLKAQGLFGLPRDMWHVYRWIKPGWLQYAKPHEFAIVSRQGDIGVGTFPFHEWHKREGEDILQVAGIKVQFEERPEEGADRGRYKTVGDEEHARIISLYTEEGKSMESIGKQLGRSAKTVYDHIHEHNNDVERLGYCPKCRRASSPLAEVKTTR